MPDNDTPIALQLIFELPILLFVFGVVFYILSILFAGLPASPYLTPINNWITNVHGIVDSGMLFLVLAIGFIELVRDYENPSTMKALRTIIIFLIFGYLSLVLQVFTSNIITVTSVNSFLPNFTTLITSNYLIAFILFLLVIDIIINFRKPDQPQKQGPQYAH